MSATQDAALIEAAVDRLRVDHPAPAVLEAATTALTDPEQNRAWLTEVAEHVASGRPCCEAGAAQCEFAHHALAMARRILDAGLVEYAAVVEGVVRNLAAEVGIPERLLLP